MSDATAPASAAATQRVRVDLGERSYDVVIGRGLLDRDAAWGSPPAGASAMVVTNPTVAPLYLERLLRRYVRDGAEVEDLRQKTFVTAYLALPGFRGDSEFFSWLYSIGVNTAKRHLARSRRGYFAVRPHPAS